MHRRILGYSRRDSASGMFANNAIDTFDALLRKNIYGFKRHILNINNDLIRVIIYVQLYQRLHSKGESQTI